jgi:hypothetical protein
MRFASSIRVPNALRGPREAAGRPVVAIALSLQAEAVMWMRRTRNLPNPEPIEPLEPIEPIEPIEPSFRPCFRPSATRFSRRSARACERFRCRKAGSVSRKDLSRATCPERAQRVEGQIWALIYLTNRKDGVQMSQLDCCAIQRELGRLSVALRDGERPECYREFYAAQQALSWVLNPSGACAPFDAITCIREVTTDYSAESRPLLS